jgi:DNA-binding LytR/AlgR family response regulator
MPTDQRTLILIVEDEALIRMSGCDMLDEAGFEVLEAATADEAIELLEQHEIQVLFTDVDMPGSMNGLELAGLSMNGGHMSACWSPRGIVGSKTTLFPTMERLSPSLGAREM